MTDIAWCLVIALLVPSAHVPCQTDAQGVQEIRAVVNAIVGADNRRDLQQVLDYYATDAVLLPPGEAPVVGRDRIRPRYEALFAAFTPEIELRIDEACVGAALGFVRGHNGGRLVSRTSRETRLLDDAFIMVLRLESVGVWRISHLIWHRQSEATPKPLEE